MAEAIQEDADAKDQETFAETLGDSDTAAAVKAGMQCAGVKSITLGKAPLLALPSGVGIHNLEQYLDRPTRIEAERNFEEPDSFCAYVKEFLGTGTVRVYGDVDQQTFSADLDDDMPDKPTWGGHKAHLRLKLSPEWEQWKSAFGKSMPQIDLAEFLEDHLEQIAEPAAADLLSGIRNISAARNWKVSSIIREGGGIIFSLQEETSGKTSTGNMPATIQLMIAPFRSWDVIPLTVNVTYRLKDGQLYFTMRGHQVERTLAQSFNDVRTHVEERLGLKVLI